VNGGGKASAIVTRVLPAPPEVVYDEWLDVDALTEFMCPSPGRPGTVECDPRVGGKLRIVMIQPDHVVNVVGEYLDLSRPRRIRFTWNSDYRGGFESVVTVNLDPHGEDETLITIEHQRLPEHVARDHEQGWSSIASKLEGLLARP
jgi:uncharacterized protein YndB with AHSA1/START domain